MLAMYFHSTIFSVLAFHLKLVLTVARQLLLLLRAPLLPKKEDRERAMDERQMNVFVPFY